MRKTGTFLGDWWRLASPYFLRSDDRRLGVILLITALALVLASVWLEVLFNEWYGRFYDSLEKKDEPTFWREIKVFTGLAFLFIFAGVARYIARPYLELRWRRWMTGHYLRHWLDGRGYYRIELERTIDNADQRIADDLRLLTEYSTRLLLGLVSAIATLVSFLFILWTLSGPLSLKPIGIDFEIPGYMAWAALLYAIVGTVFAHLVGRRLGPLNFEKQRYEANFRFALVRVRENAEGIALYSGEGQEARALDGRFSDVFAIAWRVMFTQAQLVLYQVSYGQLAIIFPFVVSAPRFFAGVITLGGVMKIVSAFGQVQTALSFFVDNYTLVAELRAVMDRLIGLQQASDEKPAAKIELEPRPGAADIAVEGLTLALPNGQALLQDTSLALPKGSSTLVMGQSGSGKSTLFRALAGIWPFGQGRVVVPAGARVLFLPQKPYIPIATLRDAVKYPDERSQASDAEIVEALEAVQLGHLTARLDEEAHWSNVLSGGEQQRLAIARALVFKPDWLFMDEGTASLDETMEAAAYGELKKRLAGTTVVSIGHRPSLQKWHDRRLELRRKPGEVGRLVEGTP